MEFLVFVGFFGLLVSLISLIKPLTKIGIKDRETASYVLLGSFAIMLVGGMFVDKSDDPAGSDNVANSTQVAPAGPGISAKQAGFITAVGNSRERFNSAPNELIAAGVRADRRKAICNILDTRKVEDWHGHLIRLSTNSGGAGILAVAIGSDIQLTTWSNSFSDISAQTLISPSDPLYAAASMLTVGDAIVFSGRFFSSPQDCVDEQSLTIRGSMNEPEFTFRFSSIEKR